MTNKSTDIAILEQQDAQHAQRMVERCYDSIELVMPQSTEEKWDYVIRSEENAFKEMARRGFVYLALKQKLPHGQFERDLKEKALSPRVVQYAVTIAKMLMALPESKTKALSFLNMNKTQLIEIARLPLQTLESLDDEDLETLSDLSTRELKKEILRLKTHNRELDIERADAINELGNERVRKSPTTRFDLPVFIAQCRSDAIAYTEMLEDALAQSVAQTTQLVEKRSLDFDSRLAAAQTMHHCWASIYMQVGQMLERLHGEFGEHIQGIENLPRFNEAEWEYIDSERSRMLEAFQTFYASKQGAK